MLINLSCSKPENTPLGISLTQTGSATTTCDGEHPLIMIDSVATTSVLAGRAMPSDALVLVDGAPVNTDAASTAAMLQNASKVSQYEAFAVNASRGAVPRAMHHTPRPTVDSERLVCAVHAPQTRLQRTTSALRH